MADKRTGELDPVKESPIGGLPEVLQLYDETLIPVEQLGEAMRMTGRQFRQFGEKTVELYVDTAKDAAQEAAEDARRAREAAEDAAGSAESAKQYSGKPPKPQNGTWWIWDAGKQEYVDTGVPTEGDVLYAVFYVDPATGTLYMAYDERYGGPGFRLNGNDLEVVLDAQP